MSATTKPAQGRSLGRQLADLLASFELSVSILVLMSVVTFFGTIAQVDHGLHMAQKMYFESWFVSHPLGPLKLPLPGGQLLMALLAVNLFFGGLFRIRRNRRTYGIIVVHLGVVLMLLAALVKHRFSEDGRLTLREGDSGAHFVHYHDWEVAVYDATQLEDVDEWLIPQEDFLHLTELDQPRKFSAGDLPLELTLKGYVRNAKVVRAPMGSQTALPVVDGYTVVPQPPETTNEQNVAALYVSAMDRSTGRVEEGILYGGQNHPWIFEAGGIPWAVDLRHEHFNMPFEVRLVDFVKTEHARTTMAASFSSDVIRIQDGEEYPVHIRMNEPLRHDGMILFQSGFGEAFGNDGSVVPTSTFAVVRNPSDQWPTYSMFVIGLGMLWAFVVRLVDYIQGQSRQRRKQSGTPAQA